MWQYKTRQANRSQAESGHQAGGVSSLYFVLIWPSLCWILCVQAELLLCSKAWHMQSFLPRFGLKQTLNYLGKQILETFGY